MYEKLDEAQKILQLMLEKIDEIEETLVGQGRPLGVPRLHNQTGQADTPLPDRGGRLEDDLEGEEEEIRTVKMVFS